MAIEAGWVYGHDAQTTPAMDEDGILLCPRCGGDYMHHGETRVLNRDHEDGDGVEITVTGASEVQRRPLPAGDFPGRRDAVEIAFTCEYCEDGESDAPIGVLRIIQHKGRTFMGWVVRPPA